MPSPMLAAHQIFSSFATESCERTSLLLWTHITRQPNDYHSGNKVLAACRVFHLRNRFACMCVYREKFRFDSTSVDAIVVIAAITNHFCFYCYCAASGDVCSGSGGVYLLDESARTALTECNKFISCRELTLLRLHTRLSILRFHQSSA